MIQTELLVNIIFILCAFSLMYLVYLLWQSNKMLTFFQGKVDEQSLSYITVSNEKDLSRVLNIIPKLSSGERELILQQLWGRPIKIVKGIDRGGGEWIETVTYYAPQDNADFNFHYEKNRDKNMFG